MGWDGALLGMIIVCARLRNLPMFGSMSSAHNVKASLDADSGVRKPAAKPNVQRRVCRGSSCRPRTRIYDLDLVGEAQREQRHRASGAAPGLELRRYG